MDFTTDLQIKKWKPTSNNEVKRVGKGLYVRGFLSGRKLFQIRYKQQWIDLDDYGKKTLATAQELSMASLRKLKANEVSISQLKASLSRSTSTDDLNQELTLKPMDIAASSTGIPTFGEFFKQWYQLQISADRWTHKASINKPIKAYENHLADKLGNLRIDKISRMDIKSVLQPIYISNRKLGPDLRAFIDEVFEDAVDAELIDHNPVPPNKRFVKSPIKAQHAPSIHFGRLPELWKWIEEAPFSLPVKVAMRTAIVTVHRASVVAFARWDHIDLETGEWIVPEKPAGIRHEGYMKSGRRFAMKLPNGLLADFRSLHNSNEAKPSEFVFTLRGRPINAETLRRNFKKFDNISTHGMRNTFKTWCLHQGEDQFVVDRYTDHSLQGLDAAYRRDDMYPQRAELAERYFAYITGAA